MTETGYLNDFDTQLERVISQWDREHTFVSSGLVELPFGRGRRYGSGWGGVTNTLLGGWQVSYIYKAQSGAPLGFGNFLFAEGMGVDDIMADDPSVNQWFNVNAFNRVTGQQLVSNVRTQPSRFAEVRGPGYSVLDLALLKNIGLGGSRQVQFRIEAYNALNTFNMGGPNTGDHQHRARHHHRAERAAASAAARREGELLKYGRPEGRRYSRVALAFRPAAIACIRRARPSESRDSMPPTRQSPQTAPPLNSPRQVLFASLIGTTIEFFDFYIYATAAVIVFPRLFFPASDPASATLASLATFGIAFVARPVGSALFGHFGDRIGRKTTLVAALLTMGRLDGDHRRAADVCGHRRRGAAAAGAVPVRSGAGSWRRMERRGAAGGRECAARQACVVRHVSPARRAARVLLLRRHVPGALRDGSPTSSSSGSAGAFRSWPARCSSSSACTCGWRSTRRPCSGRR